MNVLQIFIQPLAMSVGLRRDIKIVLIPKLISGHFWLLLNLKIAITMILMLLKSLLYFVKFWFIVILWRIQARGAAPFPPLITGCILKQVQI